LYFSNFHFSICIFPIFIFLFVFFQFSFFYLYFSNVNYSRLKAGASCIMASLLRLLPLKSGRFLYHGISIETTRSGSSSSSWSDDFSYIYFFFRRRMVFFIFSGIDPICSGINFGFPVVVSLKIPLHIDIRLNTSFSIDAFVLFSLNISM